MRTFTLPRRVGANDRVVITHPADPKTGVPALTATARTIGGAVGDGAEGCEWKVETRVVRRKRARSQVRIRVACIPPGAKRLKFSVSVLRKGKTKASRVRTVTLSTGREQEFIVKARLKRGDRINLLHTGDTRRATPRITSRATVSRTAARKKG